MPVSTGRLTRPTTSSTSKIGAKRGAHTGGSKDKYGKVVVPKAEIRRMSSKKKVGLKQDASQSW
jgi:hypothetical protein